MLKAGVICAGLLITGFGLQLITGPVQAGLFQYPVNVAGGLIFLLVLCIGFVVGPENHGCPVVFPG